jgi:uncharacterized protein YneF (UPF0154 family)
MALYLNILTVVLLSLVAGLLLTLFFQLRTWREANREAPLLAEKLTEAMLSTRKGLSDLKHELTAQAPELNRLLSEAGKLRVEMQYLLQRGTQLADGMDANQPKRPVIAEEDEIDMPEMRLSHAAQAVVERVAGVNGLAAKPLSQIAKVGDPLEELLAGLQTEPVKRSPGKRKRSGPITQAELDLQQSLLGNVLSGDRS